MRAPRGAIAQTEVGRSHEQFIEAVEPSTVLVKIQYARQFIKRGITAADRFPDETTVVTTTSIRDRKRAALPLEHNGFKMGEVDIIREFAPDFHVPADRSDYKDFPDDKRFERVTECMEGTLTVANHIADHGLDTRILPWFKGVTREERQLAYRTIEQLGLNYGVFYANPYFQNGNRWRELVDDLEYIAEESTALMDHTDKINICVLGCQSPAVLSELPDAVVASSGLWVGQNRRWRGKITPTKQSADEMQRIYADARARVRDALGLQEVPDSQQPATAQTQAQPHAEGIEGNQRTRETTTPARE